MVADELNERQRTILRVLVEQYVSTVRPVASEVLAGQYDLGVSPATIRNTLADLERLGYITQPHTSAGRVPSDKGYRYFVEHLMGSAALPLDEQRTIQHQFHQVQMNVEEWSHLAAAVLARLVRNAAVVTPPQSTAARLKHFELLSLTETSVMVVLVAHDGTISQQLLTLDEPWDQERLSVLAGHLNRLWRDLTGPQLAETPAPDDLAPLARQVGTVLGGLLARLEEPGGAGIYREGLSHMLEQPEFRETDRMRQMFELLEGGGVLLSIIPAVRASAGVQVIIGDEHQNDQMRHCSVVVARYGLADQVSGVLGVVGPTRMPYGRAVSSVRYLADLLGTMLYQVYGESSPERGAERL
jgi:heat-inducible transcriptional repressor